MTSRASPETGTIYVLVPVHDRRSLTERFVRCLTAQSDQDFHLVLVDDGSRDGTSEMVRSIIPTATIIEGTGDWWWAGSLEQARRWLARRPAGPDDLVLIANDDTTFAPDFLERARASMRGHPRSLLLAEAFSAQTGDSMGLGVQVDWSRLAFRPSYDPDALDCFSTRGLFLRLRDFLALGPFHTVLLPHYLSDYEYTLRATRRGFQLRTDPAVRLVMDETATGTRVREMSTRRAFLKSVLSIKATQNPIYWTTFVVLASPKRYLLPNLVRIWRRFGSRLIRSGRTDSEPGLLEPGRAWALRRVRRRIVSKVRRHPELGLEKIGTAYGGWVVPTRMIGPTWRCYCGGVGEDVSFDLGLIERFGCEVVAFDPTPRAIAYAEPIAAGEPRFRFLPVGLWSEDTTLRFYRPRDPAHVSHSAVNLQKTDEWFEAPVRRLDTLMAELGHASIDLLKLDIEGAEHGVLASVLAAGIRPKVVCFEVDQPVSAGRLWTTVRSMLRQRYELVSVDGWNYTFIQRDALLQVGRRPIAAAEMPKVSFGIIVLNGEPYTRHILRSLYPFAHEIIVVEGGAPAARNIADADGHSRDGTLTELRRFKADEDPDDKLTIVTAEDEGHPDGWWPGEKDEQSRAYAKRATGDYLWQVDIDEFYLAEDMVRVLQMLRDDPTITAVTFKQITFWGGLDYTVDGWYLRRGATYYHRLFKWGPGYTYATHRPPTVLDGDGRDLRTLNWVRGEELAREGIYLYHYSLLLPKQVIEKCDYYGNATWTKRPAAVAWAQDAYLRLGRPYRVHNVYDFPSWLERYAGPHPEQVTHLVADLTRDDPAALRATDDIERLLRARWYRVGRRALMVLDPMDSGSRALARRGKRRLRRLARRSANRVLGRTDGAARRR